MSLGIVDVKSFYILVGPENKEQVLAAQEGKAPRLDYRVLAEQIEGEIVEGSPPPAQISKNKVLAIIHSLFANFISAVHLLRQIPDESVIFSTGETWGLPCGLAMVLLRKKQIRHFIYVHRVFSTNWSVILSLIKSFIAVDGWICVTNKQKEALRETLGAMATIDVVSQGVDTHFFSPNAIKHSIPSDAYILSIGAEMRDYGLLIEAAKSIDMEIVIKASSRWMHEGREKIDTFPTNVTLINKRMAFEEIRNLYAGAKVVVLPLIDTLQAAGISTILEAMAMGKCVVATQSAGLPDLISENRSAIIVKPNADDIAQTLEQCVSNEDKFEEMTVTGNRLVRAFYKLEDYSSAIIELIAN